MYLIDLFVLTNRHKIDYTPCLLVASFFEVAVSILVIEDISFIVDVSNRDFAFLVLMGVVVLALGSALLTNATRYVAAAEVSLFMILDTLLEPIW